MSETVPLRWIHMTEPGQSHERALGVYVHAADVLYALDAQGEAAVRRAIEDLLDARASEPRERV
jgi:hypothetical protein